jgi:archaellum component FlaG (FlaF/FlaG flagellin family)
MPLFCEFVPQFSYLCWKRRKLSVVIDKECLTTAMVRVTAARGNGWPKGRGELLAPLTVELDRWYWRGSHRPIKFYFGFN